MNTKDLIADLKNGFAEYDNLDANIREYLLKDGDDYVISFGGNDNEMSGYRLPIKENIISNNYEDFINNLK